MNYTTICRDKKFRLRSFRLITIYSEGAINSTVAFLTSGLFAGSPYCLVTGSKQNSSGTKTKKSGQ